jgi:hypothetical protein
MTTAASVGPGYVDPFARPGEVATADRTVSDLVVGGVDGRGTRLPRHIVRDLLGISRARYVARNDAGAPQAELTRIAEAGQSFTTALDPSKTAAGHDRPSCSVGVGGQRPRPVVGVPARSGRVDGEARGKLGRAP